MKKRVRIPSYEFSSIRKMRGYVITNQDDADKIQSALSHHISRTGEQFKSRKSIDGSLLEVHRIGGKTA